MPNAVPPPTSDTDRMKMESAVSSAAASPAPSVASSKDDKVRNNTKSTGDGKDKDASESGMEDSTDADLMDVDRKPSSQSETGDGLSTGETGKDPSLVGEDIKNDLTEKLQKELKKEELEESDAKDDTKDSIGEAFVVNFFLAIDSFVIVK